jgi:hypothetical protein
MYKRGKARPLEDSICRLGTLKASCLKSSRFGHVLEVLLAAGCGDDHFLERIGFRGGTDRGVGRVAGERHQKPGCGGQ